MRMKLLRLATIYIQPLPQDIQPWSAKIGQVELQTLSSIVVEAHRGNISTKTLEQLVVASIELDMAPEATQEGFVVVPENARKEAEKAIELVANATAICGRCSRHIESPPIHVAFLPLDEEAGEFLNASNGVDAGFRPRMNIKPAIKPELIYTQLRDRLDGVALLSEAISTAHPTGKLHEFVRLFEKAFLLSSYKLVPQLASFLLTANLGYSETEVKHWVKDLRDPATHADEKMHKEFLLASDILPFIDRVEQAAYDVLFNKEKWRNASTVRRSIWTPPGGTTSPGHDTFIKRDATEYLEVSLMDTFGAYPLDVNERLKEYPAEWYKKIAKKIS